MVSLTHSLGEESIELNKKTIEGEREGRERGEKERKGGMWYVHNSVDEAGEEGCLARAWPPASDAAAGGKISPPPDSPSCVSS